MISIDTVTCERARKSLTLVLTIALVLALGGVAYVALTPGAAEDPFTEFYILGPEGNATDYPTERSPGETGEIIVGITNNEQRTMTYTVVLALGGDSIGEETVTVEHGDTWEQPTTFRITEPGEHRLDVLLFTGESPDSLEEPYREVQLVIVVEADSQ